MMNKNDLQTILQGTFDAGILVDNGGNVVFANDAAVDLLGLSTGTPGRFKSSIGSIASILSFWSYSILDATQGRKDILDWKDVLQYLKKHPELAPDEWIVTCMQKESSSSSFPGVVKLTLLDDSNLAVCYIRHKDKQGAGGGSAVSSTGVRRGSFEKGATASNDNDDSSLLPTVTVNATDGTILQSNQAAEKSFDWCHVGKSLTEVWSQPTMTIDENGIILHVNGDQTAHWSTADLVGHHVSSIIGGSNNKEDSALQAPATTTTDAAPTTEHPPRRLSSTSSTRSSSGRWPSFRRKSQQQNHLQIIIQATTTKNIHQGETIDISNSKQQQEDTLASQASSEQRESILLAILEASLDPLFQINQQGTIQMVNKAATLLFGYSREEFLHSNISIICGGPHAQHHSTYMQRYLSTGDTRVMNTRRELPAKKKDGSEFPIELALVEVDTYLGDERLFCGFVRDLSNIKDEARAQLRGGGYSM